jgi:membrane-associated phospholipid phosphatase
VRVPRHSVRSPLLAGPRHWVWPVIVLWVLTFALGFAVRAVPSLFAGQLDLDRALNNAHTPLLDTVALAFDGLDHVKVVALYIVVLFVVGGLLFGWSRALGAGIVAGAGWLLCLIPKQLVHEERPPTDALAHHLDAGRATLSYPSGHVVFAVTFSVAAIMLVRGVLLRLVVGIVGAAFVVVTMWARLYVGAHYPTDVVGSIFAGVGGALLIAALWNLVVAWLGRSRGGRARA